MTGRGNRFAVFLIAAYLVQGVAQHFCLILQPLEFHLMRVHGMDAVAVAAFLAALMIPWTIKPLFALVSDAIPLGGFSKKSYILLSYLLAAAGFAGVGLGWLPLLPGMLLTAVGMSTATAVLTGLVFQMGNRSNSTRKLLGMQATAYYSAAIACGWLGGWLCQNLGPVHALGAAALACADATLIAAGATAGLLRERRCALKDKAPRVFTSLRDCFTGRRIYLIGGFIFLFSASPGLSTALYFFYSNHLHLAQSTIGALNAVNCLGMLTAAVLFGRISSALGDARRQIACGLACMALSSLGFTLLSDALIAFPLEYLRGAASMLTVLSMYGLAADVSPRHVESTTSAVLIAVHNAGTQVANIGGAWLFTRFLHESLSGLALAAAAYTFCCLLLLRFFLAGSHTGPATPILSAPAAKTPIIARLRR